MTFSHLVFDCAQDDPKCVADAFVTHDVIALRGAIDPDAVRRMRSICVDFFASIERKAEKNHLEQMTLYKGASGARLLSEEMFGVDTIFPEMVCRLTIGQPMIPFLQAILGTTNPAIVQSYIGVRRKDPLQDTSLLPFHQDAYAGGPSAVDRLVLTGFLPFEDVGDVRPSIDVIARKTEQTYALHGAAGKAYYENLHLDEAAFSDELSHLWSPKVGPGDIVLFSGRTPHRSQHSPLNTERRHSLDLRFVDAINPPERFSDVWVFDTIEACFTKASRDPRPRLKLRHASQ